MRTLLLLRRLSLPVLALLSLLIGACAEPPTGAGPAGKLTVSGMLADEAGFIVPGALVEAIAQSDTRLAFDTTDDNGAFALAGLPDNLTGVRLRVAHSDFKPFTSDIRTILGMAGGNDGVMVNVLHNDSCCARITVAVTGANNVALAGVQVKLRRGGQHITTGTTDSAGNVTFSNVCSGEFNLRLAKEGYAVAERGGINIDGCDTTNLEFTMRATGGNGEPGDSCCNGVLKIIPLDSASNEAISGVHVKVKRVGGNTRVETSGANGATFREMCAGTYQVRLSREGNPGYRVVEFSVTLGCNDTVTTERRMVRNPNNGEPGDSCCNAKVIVIPRDSSGNNAVLNGATVKLWKGNQLVASRIVAEGKAVFEGLCPGNYSINISKPGYRGQESDFELGCNQVKEIVRYLKSEGGGEGDSCCNGRVQIVVRDSTTNDVIANATVKLWKGGQLKATATTNANGVAVFEGLCKGSYGVDLIREGYFSREFQIALECNQRLETTRKLLSRENGGGDSVCCTAKFKFRVKDSTVAEGGWLNGVNVKIKKGNDVIATGTTNADGYYVREALCGNATYTIFFSKEGFVQKSITITLEGCRVVEETIKIRPD